MIAGQWISACVRPIVAEHSRRAKGIIMAVHRGEVVIFVLEHEAGVEECAVARDTLLDLARRHRADVSLDELLDIFDAHRKKIEAAALRKFRKGDYDVGGVLVTSADLGPHV